MKPGKTKRTALRWHSSPVHRLTGLARVATTLRRSTCSSRLFSMGTLSLTGNVAYGMGGDPGGVVRASWKKRNAERIASRIRADRAPLFDSEHRVSAPRRLQSFDARLPIPRRLPSRSKSAMEQTFKRSSLAGVKRRFGHSPTCNCTFRRIPWWSIGMRPRCRTCAT